MALRATARRSSLTIRSSSNASAPMAQGCCSRSRRSTGSGTLAAALQESIDIIHQQRDIAAAQWDDQRAPAGQHALVGWIEQRAKLDADTRPIE